MSNIWEDISGFGKAAYNQFAGRANQMSGQFSAKEEDGKWGMSKEMEDLYGVPVLPYALAFRFLGGMSPQATTDDPYFPVQPLRPSIRSKANPNYTWYNQIGMVPDKIYPSPPLRNVDLRRITNKKPISLDNEDIDHLYLGEEPFDNQYIAELDSPYPFWHEMSYAGQSRNAIGRDEKGYYYSNYDLYDEGGEGSTTRNPLATLAMPIDRHQIEGGSRMAGLRHPYYAYTKVRFDPDTLAGGKLVMPRVINVKNQKPSREEEELFKSKRAQDLFGRDNPPVFVVRVPKEKYGKKKTK